jgi:predicted ATP-grasp superfamily ATP-dependent carboligase
MPDSRPAVLLAGVSTRALAESAARAGYRVIAVDAFGDADLRAVAEVVPLPRSGERRYGADVAARTARSVPAALVAYTSNFENHPPAVALLARDRRLLGNPPRVLARVRNPILLARTLTAHGFRVPRTRASAPANAVDGPRWLLKPRRSGGGHGTTAWRRGRSVPRGAYLQERIAGPSGSIIFAADGGDITPLGLTRQLVGMGAFGSDGFRYCGSLLASRGPSLFARQPELLGRATALARAVTATFGLRGLNGIDFIARDGVPFPIEVNPRYSASMELVERGTGVSLFRVHEEACAGRLGDAPAAGREILGKAIVFARHEVVVDHPGQWGVDLADIPHPGERIAAGRPICTVFARARDGDACTAALAAAADRVYRATARRVGGAA